MENKLIIFVVFAAMALSFSVRSSAAASAILPDSAVADFRQIKTNENTALFGLSKGFDLIYDIIIIRAALLIAKATATSNDESAQVAEARVLLKIATDSSFDAVLVATGVSSSDAVEEARNASHCSAENGFVDITEALALAASACATDDNASKIEAYHSQAQEHFVALITNFFASIASCLTANSSDITDIIEVAQAKATRSVVLTINAIFNAIRVYAAAVVVQTADYRLLKTIENFRTNKDLGVQGGVAHKFAVLRAIYIDLNHDGNTLSVADLYEVAYSHSYSINMYEDTVDAFFSVVFAYAINVTLGLSAVEMNDFISKDIQEHRSNAKWEAGTHEILLAALPDDSSASVEAAFEELDNLARYTTSIYFREIQVANTVVSNVYECLDEIDRLNAIVVAGAVTYVATVFDALTSPYNVTDEVQEKITALQTSASDAFINFANGVANTTTLLAKAASGGETTDLLTNIGTLKDTGVSIARLISDLFTYAKLLLIAYA